MPVTLTRPVLSAEQRRAAKFLERVYWAAEETGRERHPAGWIDPNEKMSPNQRAILAIAFPSADMMRSVGLDERSRWYRIATEKLMPAIHLASRWWAATTLERQELMIGTLRMTVDREADRLHEAALRVQKEADRVFATTPLTRDEYVAVTGQTRRSRGTVTERLMRARYMHAAKDPKIGDRNLFRLMVHPDGVKIVNEYARSAEDGRAFAGKALDDCLKAIIEVRGNLIDDEDFVWRFPTAVAGGVVALGLGNRPGVSGFSIAWAAFKGKSDIESALGIAGNAIFALELVGGPIGAAIAEVLDFVVAIIGTVATFMLELEQDQAAEATTFGTEDEKLAEVPSHVGTVLQGVTALVAAAALPGAISQITRRANRAATQLVAADLPPIREIVEVAPAGSPLDIRGLGARGIEREGITVTERAAAEGNRATVATAEARTTIGVGSSAKPSGEHIGLPEHAGVTSQLDEWRDFHDPTVPTSVSPGVVVDPRGRFTAAPEVLAGFTMRETLGFKRLIGKPLDHSEIAVFGTLWNGAARPGDVAQLTLSNARDLFDLQRVRFWNAVRNNTNAVAILGEAGVAFRRGPGTAPSWIGPNGEEILMTIDHIVERQTNPKLALSASNLRLSFARENTVVLRLLNQMDPFQ